MCWTVVGDAAMAFDSLSSQGMIIAIPMISSRRELFLNVREDYKRKKKYSYRRARFNGVFGWQSAEIFFPFAKSGRVHIC